MVVTAPTIGQLFSDDGNGERRDEDGVMMGFGLGPAREIAEVPACANCVVECEADSTDQGAVVQNALRRVDRMDGGMARKRWEKREGTISKRAVGQIRRVPATALRAIQSPSPPPNHRQRSVQGLIRTSYTPRLPYDGALSGSDESAKNDGDCVVPLDSTIYVSIFDPIGGPVFKPSPTKPIPRWMQWLPSQRDHTRQNEPQPHSVLDEHFPPNPIARSNAVCPTNPPQYPPYLVTPSYPINRYHTPPGAEFSNLAESTIKTFKGPSFVLDEPLKRPSSRIAQSASNSPKTAIVDPMATPIPPEALPPRTHSPYAPRHPSPLATYEENSDHGNSNDKKDWPWKARLHRRPSSPLAEQVAAHLNRYVRRTRTPPAQSREFINLYGTARSSNPGPSAAVPGRTLDRIVGDGRPVRDALGRDRTPSPLGGRNAGCVGGGGVRQAVIGTGEVVDLRTVRKRSSLQSEIKKLLGGKKEKE